MPHMAPMAQQVIMNNMLLCPFFVEVVERVSYAFRIGFIKALTNPFCSCRKVPELLDCFGVHHSRLKTAVP
jgi:hypothetical protein